MTTLPVRNRSGLWVSGTVSTPTTPINTATSGALKEWMVNTGTVRNYSRTTQEADGVRWTKSITKFNADSLPYEVDDLGDETTTDDDRCTRTWYARNAANWILDKAKKTETVGVACSSHVTPDGLLPGASTAGGRRPYCDGVPGGI